MIPNGNIKQQKKNRKKKMETDLLEQATVAQEQPK
jgi:hypothetical protein